MTDKTDVEGDGYELDTCEKCVAAKVAGYATCAQHREFKGLAAVVGHAFVVQDGTGHDTEQQAERNALRTWRPQVVHYHTNKEPCNEKCHQIFPNDLPYWGGANPE